MKNTRKSFRDITIFARVLSGRVLQCSRVKPSTTVTQKNRCIIEDLTNTELVNQSINLDLSKQSK